MQVVRLGMVEELMLGLHGVTLPPEAARMLLSFLVVNPWVHVTICSATAEQAQMFADASMWLNATNLHQPALRLVYLDDYGVEVEVRVQEAGEEEGE
jgi:hypothetical protein